MIEFAMEFVPCSSNGMLRHRLFFLKILLSFKNA